MIPLRDNIPSRSTPVVTYALLAINIAVFLLQLTVQAQSEVRHNELLMTYGMKPEFLVGWLRDEVVEVTRTVAVQGRFGLQAREVTYLVEPTFQNSILPYFTCMFLHGGLLHLGSNMLYLWIFGDNVEDTLGRWRFLAFYLLAGFAGSVTHTLFEWGSTIPTIGASGAIAGVLGGYMLRYPKAKVLSLVPLGFIITMIEVPAVILLGLWFVLQVFQGLSPEQTGVASWAHAGGFVAGLVLMAILTLGRRRRRPPSRYRDVDFEVLG